MVGQYWGGIKDGDPRAVGLYRSHYSCTNKKADHMRFGFSGQGESMLLLTVDSRALFGWRRQKLHDDGQVGVNCFVFRNEGQLLSSVLINEACEWAWAKWPNERLYTYVNGSKIRSTNPGYCFLKAGWERCGTNKDGRLTILERKPNPEVRK